MTALCTVHVTAALLLPVTVEKNCCVLTVPVDGDTKEYAGETATLTGLV